MDRPLIANEILLERLVDSGLCFFEEECFFFLGVLGLDEGAFFGDSE